jgi:hypothetical protein
MEEEYYIENLIEKYIKKSKAKFKGSQIEFEKLIKDRIPEVIENISRGVMDEIYNYCLGSNNDTVKHERKIIRKIKKNYAVGIKIFEAFIELNSKISSITYNKYHTAFKEYNDQKKLDTLIANHVRACQIANEIKVLIANGFADGAHARWRTLHEISIIFLYLYDADYETIEMYNNYEIIESWKKAKEYNECYSELNFDPLEEGEMEYLEGERKKLIDKYGKEYAESYGWTLKDLLPGRRNIRQLEKLVGMDHLRVIYTWANENVHGGVSGIKTRLSLREDEQHFFLMGPNDCGFLDPVQFTSYSLMEISDRLLDMEDSIMNTILSEILCFFQNELVKEFQA